MASMPRYTDVVEPSIEWTEDPKNHVLYVNLPDFGKDEFKVQVDRSGKLTVTGGKALGDGKFLRLRQVFDVPKDSYADKISGKFDQGRLSLFMPKKVVTETEKPAAEGKKEEEPSVYKKKPLAEEEPIQKKKPEGGEETKEPSFVYKEKPLIEEAPIQKEKPRGEKETKEVAAPVYEEKPPEKKEEQQPIQDEPISKQKPKEEEHPVQAEPTQKLPRSGTVGEGFEKYKKKAMAWKERIEEEVEGWLDHGPIDGLMETICKNKKIIALAAAAFTAGFYASQKLRSSRR